MIGLDIQAQYLCLMRSRDLTNDLFQPYGDLFYQYLAPVFGTPHDVVLAGVVDISVGLVGNLVHRDSIQHRAIYCQVAVLPHFPSHLKRNAPYIPIAKAKGFTARFDNKL